MPNKTATVRKFRQAARQRLTTAEFLLRYQMNIDSMYLAGYAVECALKALILGRTPDRTFATMFRRLTAGRKAHDYEMLKAILKGAPIHVTFPRVVVTHFQSVTAWTTALRYEVGLGDSTRTVEFVKAAREIVRWAENTW